MSTGQTKPLLVLGADGMLGRAIVQWCTQEGRPFHARTFPAFDLASPDSIRRSLEGEWDAVVNCAAFTDVDGAETSERLAFAVNAVGPASLAHECRQQSVPLVHFSTDYVFAGNGAEPYPPIDPPAASPPANAYGRSKLAGERAIAASGCRHLIIRTSWLYAPWAKNFVRTITAAARSRPELRVVDDQRGRPTSAQHLARCALQLLSRVHEPGMSGVWHVTDGGACSWFEFACEIVRLANASCSVHPCSTSEFPRPARRPAFSVLDLAKTVEALGPMPDWRTNLAQVMSVLEPL
ncbi:MAG: dTDP-4-dehydrorhamnose reductase [Phycisphaerales bacterium]